MVLSCCLIGSCGAQYWAVALLVAVVYHLKHHLRSVVCLFSLWCCRNGSIAECGVVEVALLLSVVLWKWLHCLLMSWFLCYCPHSHMTNLFINSLLFHDTLKLWHLASFSVVGIDFYLLVQLVASYCFSPTDCDRQSLPLIAWVMLASHLSCWWSVM